MNAENPLLGANPASFHNEIARLQTFIGWSNPAVRPDDLARAGFIYLGSDQVRCVYCKGILGSWDSGDVPLEEHRKHFPQCPFLVNGTLSNQLTEFPGGYDVAGNGRPPKASQARKKSVIVIRNVIRHNAPKHPNYGLMDSRVRSFDSWPKGAKLPINKKCMAEAGFFYTGTADKVSCFHCGQSLMEWEENDDPWEEHARWHPTCELILLKKGQAYVDKVARKFSPPIEIKENGIPLNSTINEEFSKSEDDEFFNEFMTLPESQEILQLGLDQSEIETAIKARPKNSKIAEIAMQLMEKAKMMAISKTSPLASNHTELLEKKSEMKEQDLRSCIVCTVQERCVTFLPCGHFSTCADCTLLLSDCPICRQIIDTIVKTYMS